MSAMTAMSAIPLNLFLPTWFSFNEGWPPQGET
jgi:hypothetical protein